MLEGVLFISLCIFDVLISHPECVNTIHTGLLDSMECSQVSFIPQYVLDVELVIDQCVKRWVKCHDLVAEKGGITDLLKFGLLF